MAEQVVLADLRINSAGVAQGISQANQAFASGQRGLQNFGRSASQAAGFTDTLTTKLFSLRSIATKLGAGFGIAGAAFAAANALFDLGKQLVMSTTFMKNLAEAATDLWKKLVEGEEVIGRLARKSEEFWKGTGVNSMQENLRKQDELRQKSFEGFNMVAKEGEATAEQWRAAAADIDAAKKGLVQLQIEAAKTGKIPLGPEARAAARAMGGPLQSGVSAVSLGEDLGKFGTSSEVLQQQNEKRKEAIKLAREEADITSTLNAIIFENAQARQLYNSAVEEALSPAERNKAILDVTAEAMERAKGVTELTGEAFAALSDSFGEMNERIKEMQEELVKLAEAMTKVDIFQSAAIGFAQVIAESFSSSSKTMRRALHDMLADLAKMYFVKAIENVALGIMASTPWGQTAGLGDPAPYFASAKLWGLAAVAAGSASAAIGGGGGGGGSRGGGGGGGLASAAAGRGGPNVTIVINGSLMGTNRDELARELKGLLEKAEDDGA